MTLAGARALAAHFADIIRGWGNDEQDLKIRGLIAIGKALGRLER